MRLLTFARCVVICNAKYSTCISNNSFLFFSATFLKVREQFDSRFNKTLSNCIICNNKEVKW